MSELQRPHDPDVASPTEARATAGAPRDSSARSMFSGEPTPAAGLPLVAWGVAGVVVLVVIAVLLFATRRKALLPNTIQPLAAYAASLPLSQLTMSESTSLSGGKSTYIDGQIRNTGDKVVTAVTVQVLFGNDEGMPPQVETEALPLVRTRQPYVDTQPVSAAPLRPGDQRDFRLIFESIPANWNTQMPAILVISAAVK